MMTSASSAAKLKSQSGLTLTELLATLLIVTLASIVMATGIPTAIETYGKIMDASNAQVLMSTTAMQLRSDLAMASEWSVSNNEITFVGSSAFEATDVDSTISVAPDNSEYAGQLRKNGKPLALSSLEKSSTKGDNEMYVTCESITEKKDAEKKIYAVVFGNLEVKRKGTDQALVTIDSYAVKMLLPDAS